MDLENLAARRERGYAVATIHHPPANAISQGVLRDLNAFLDACANDPEVRAIVITGSGEKLFSAGADVTEFGRFQTGDQPRISGHDVFLRIERYPKPIIAAIQGSALGGGLELAMACHLRVMSSTARVGQPEVKLGIIPGWGGTQRLPRLVGKTKALELLMFGDTIDAEDALHLGLVNKVVESREVLSEAKSMAETLARGAPIALREIMKAVTLGLDVPIEEGIELETAGQAICFASADAKEGATAFLRKRPPVYRGL